MLPACSVLLPVWKEEAPTTGTKHLQGLLWRDDDHRFKMSTAENMLGGRAYLTACKDFEAAQGYCVKEGDVYSNCYDVVALPLCPTAQTLIYNL